ncbi:hypothetical protein GCM10007359_14590 [Rothia aerolata]|uniref:Uncharacterized protein n=1 Tax=Rothia aerolata TaxID=1812262 RepID=A0A917MTS9_9MICC|nr:hypothetical protein GCM10007359_14590 [Rothia aerolata]
MGAPWAVVAWGAGDDSWAFPEPEDEHPPTTKTAAIDSVRILHRRVPCVFIVLPIITGTFTV